ncbi:hypothetical protein [Salinicola avicenniae]|uniref:hypothetical protein n=1 Tax=Salinicola avicenniae TaxID=2916836 RepID=UPI002072C7BB|nr:MULTISPECIES: hypothetical protein [unclassified Salinicola]
MTVFVVWIIAFAAVFLLAYKAWDGAFGRAVSRWLPGVLQGDPAQDRWIISGALAVLAATFFVNPISMLLTLILLALVIWGGKRLACWTMRRVKLH